MVHREAVYINGKEAPSVTQVIGIIAKPFLIQWYGRLGTAKCEAIKQESIDIGQAFHEAVESYFRGETLPDMDARAAQMFALWRGWATDSHFSPVELELSMQSQKYGFHGTCDAIGTFDGGSMVVIDWKTSASLDKTYALQLSAYAQMYKETTGTEIMEGIIVRVDKKEKAKKPLEVKRYVDLPSYFPTFLACLEVFRFVNEKKA